jgi:cellulose synthase/poly-beta-1,6-N-acetylglucosamine synthase-like glycosyltransferase
MITFFFRLETSKKLKDGTHPIYLSFKSSDGKVKWYRHYTGRYLRKRIESVLNQTYPNFEIIILDDCSVDSSKKIIEQYQNEQSISHIIYNSKNSGSPFKQWQKGFELAKGEYIWIAERFL